MTKYNVVRVSNDSRTPSSERRLHLSRNGYVRFAYPNESATHPVSIDAKVAERLSYPYRVVAAVDNSIPATKSQSKFIVNEFGY